ncbi:MAG: tetratricopeptide repeat protein, partial [Myxococcota bacterium]
HAILASTLDMQGQPEQALVAFQQAFQLDPRHHEIADLFIQFLLRYGHTAQARIIYQRHAEARGTADPQVRVPP